MLTKAKLIRLQKGLKLKDVSYAIGISNPYLSQLENGSVCMTLDIILRLAKYYGIDPKEIA